MSKRRSGLALQRRAYPYIRYYPLGGSTTDEPVASDPSLFFDSASNYLVMSPGISFGSTTTAFTLECWFYTTYAPETGFVSILGAGGTGPDGTSPFPTNAMSFFSINSNNTFRIDSQGRAAETFTLPTTMVQNTWYYIALTRDTSANVQIWIGTNSGSTAAASSTGPLLLNNATNWNLSAFSYLIGYWTAGSQPYNDGAYIHSLRITNTNRFATGSATIPVPTSELTSITGTQLLVNGSTIDQSGTQSLSVVGSVPSVNISPFT